jgi:hypothetical protein
LQYCLIPDQQNMQKNNRTVYLHSELEARTQIFRMVQDIL